MDERARRNPFTGYIFDSTDDVGGWIPDGTVVRLQCWYLDPDGTIDYTRDPISDVPVTWPPTPAQRQEATRLFNTALTQVPEALITLSPRQGQAALLGMPIWLHIDNWRTLTMPRVTAGLVWVEATATPVRARWVFDAPGENADNTVIDECADAGTDWERERPADRDVDRPGFCGVRVWRTTGEHPARVDITWQVAANSSEGPFTPVETTRTTGFTYRTKGLQAVERS